MSSSASNPNEILTDTNYFMWEFNARMVLARKGLQDHVAAMKLENAVRRGTEEWKAADMKALAVVAKMLSPTYQSMVREAASALEAWEILRAFFVKQSLHNRVQLRKQLHEFTLSSGGDLMGHIVRFDDICSRLAAVGETMSEDEKVVILLGSLPQEYDAMVRIIEASERVTLLDAKEMLRREYEVMKKREVKEEAFRASTRGVGDRSGRRSGSGRGGDGGRRRNGGAESRRQAGSVSGEFHGKCFLCKKFGHKKAAYPQRKSASDDEFVFSATSGVSIGKAVCLLDSGASSHMTGERLDFTEYRALATSIEIAVANGQRLHAVGVGTVKFTITGGASITLIEVLHVPRLDRKLMSISALTAKNVVVQFQADHALLLSNGVLVSKIPRVGKLFPWSVVQEAEEEASQAETTSGEANNYIWHARLGHVSPSKMNSIVKACEGLSNVSSHIEGVCEGCARGKMSTSAFARKSGSEVKTSCPLEIVHSDVMGPIQPKSKGGARFMVTFIDDFTRYVHAFLIPSKAMVLDRFKEYCALVKNQYGRRVKCIRSDNGGEYMSHRFNAFCTSSGIVHQTSAPYSPQQNGLAERMNRTLMEMARSMLHGMQVDHQWWGEVLYMWSTAPRTLLDHI
ncbi:hypothetical protein PF008_g6345 [Phytophthora fragariae]|uniref:Integrase catalytic domain-containing protein n=1 Tax=Phytophthora fragariae TaxID=53985 RepID=A0A6G0S7C2_9STRA|nr:hypothetical protein PF008_g6345 [Phytophthora fragariae]